MNHPLKLGGILFLLTAICVGILGGINEITKPIIEENQKMNEQQSMKALLKEAETFEEIPNIEDEFVKSVFKGKKSNEVCGYVLKLEPNGYAGPIKLLIGINQTGETVGISILEHGETPGFGANADKEEFKGQFIGKVAPLEVVKSMPSDQQIQAITGATITSTAITNAVNQASEFIKNHQQEWGATNE